MFFTKVHLMRSDAFSLLRNTISSGQSVEIYSAENSWCIFFSILACLFVLKALHNTEIRSYSPGWLFFFLLALNCNIVFAVLKFYSGVTDWKESWEVLVISHPFSEFGEGWYQIRLFPSVGLTSTEAVPSFFWFSDPASFWTPQQNIHPLAVPMLSTKLSNYNSSSALSLILQLKRLLLCFSTVGEL